MVMLCQYAGFFFHFMVAVLESVMSLRDERTEDNPQRTREEIQEAREEMAGGEGSLRQSEAEQERHRCRTNMVPARGV